MRIATPPAFAMAVVPSFAERRKYGPRSARAIMAELGAFGFTDDQVAAYVAACNALAAAGDQVTLQWGKRRAEYKLREHRRGLLLFARLDLILCPVPRDFSGDDYLPGAKHRLEYVRLAAVKRARATGSLAIEWTPLGDHYELWTPR